ncbi:MAG: hypothetical protein WC251_01795 [Candidatus Izemoplasmatales bacterium]|jgi:hypothetical protein
MEQNNTALALQSNNLQTSRELTPNVWGMLKEIAPDMFSSRLFGVSSKEQAVAIMLKGYELGLGVTASFEFIQVIEGKPSLSPRGALALIQSQGVLDEFKVTDLYDKAGNYFGAECYMKRGGMEFTTRFTLEDAKKAQLTEGSPTSSGKRGYGNWEKYPKNMCTWRAIGYAADVVCPDITGGLTTYLKMPEAFENVTVDDDGNFAKVVTVTPVIEAPKAITLNDLLKDWSAEAIMAANEGKIPANDAEIEATIEKLKVAA